jgi:hypothetical protein
MKRLPAPDPPPIMFKTVKLGGFVNYIDKKGMRHLALMLAAKPGGFLKLRVFRTAMPNLDINVGPQQWEWRK